MTNPSRPNFDLDGFEAKMPWWVWIWVGMLGVYFAHVMYYEITDIVEHRGERMQVHSLLASAYNMMGKWGVVGVICLFALINIGFGIWLGVRKWRKE